MPAVALIHRWSVALGCAASLALCVVTSARADSVEWSATATALYGTVRSVERTGSPAPHGVGAVVGGVLGAVIGRQFADGSRGKNVGAAVGAAAGAMIGNQIEKSVRRDQAAVRIAVALDDGSTRHFEFRENSDLRPGDRVRVEGKRLYRVS
jgi:outer membrane lipoprotein SlyB